MTKIAFTSDLSFKPYESRSDRLNYGIVIFMPEGGVRVRIGDDLSKLSAFYPKVNIAYLRNKENSIPELVQDADLDSALGILNTWGELRDVTKKDLVSFVYETEEEFKIWVQILLLECTNKPRILFNKCEDSFGNGYTSLPNDYQGPCRVLMGNGKRESPVVPNFDTALWIASYATSFEGGYNAVYLDVASVSEITHQSFSKWLQEWEYS